MNELVPLNQQIELPRNALGMMALAKELSKANGIPAIYRNPADLCMALIVMHDLGIKNPLLALQEMTPIKGNWMFSGKLCLALANTSARFAERLTFEHGGEGESRFVVVRGRLHGETETRVVVVALKDVRTDNQAWKKQPDQQLVYSGARVWMRRHTPEIILGMYFEGETIDVTPVAGPRETQPLRLHPSMSQAERTEIASTEGSAGEAVVEHSTTTEEVEERVPTTAPSDAERSGTAPFVVPRPDDSDESWRDWWHTLVAYVRAAPDVETINQWATKNAESLGALERFNRAHHAKLVGIIAREIGGRNEQGT